MAWKIGKWCEAHWKGKNFKVRFREDGEIDSKDIDPEDFIDWFETVVIPVLEKENDRHEDKTSRLLNDVFSDNLSDNN